MSWNAYPPAGLAMVSGADLSMATRYFDPCPTLFCPGDFWNPGTTITLVDLLRSLNGSDTYAADHISALAAYELVQIFTMGGSSGGTLGGWFDCADFHTHGFRPGAYTSVSVAGGPSAELRSGDDGTVRPILNPFQTSWTPLTDGLFMRPTALEWDGQDPTNDANRSVWLPSEVIGVLGAISFTHVMTQAGGQDSYFGTGVRALNVISGTPRLPGTSQPVICFV